MNTEIENILEECVLAIDYAFPNKDIEFSYEIRDNNIILYLTISLFDSAPLISTIRIRTARMLSNDNIYIPSIKCYILNDIYDMHGELCNLINGELSYAKFNQNKLHGALENTI